MSKDVINVDQLPVATKLRVEFELLHQDYKKEKDQFKFCKWNANRIRQNIAENEAFNSVAMVPNCAIKAFGTYMAALQSEHFKYKKQAANHRRNLTHLAKHLRHFYYHMSSIEVTCYWFDVRYKLPDSIRDVLCATPTGVYVGHFNPKCGSFVCCSYPVTHWMEIHKTPSL